MGGYAGLGAFDEPVVFDEAAAGALAGAARGLAGVLDDQASSRWGWAQAALVGFCGHYAGVFSSNAQAARDDARRLSSGLTDLAGEVDSLIEAARSERARRAAAREWVARQQAKGGFEKRVGRPRLRVRSRRLAARVGV